jgi:preprotein translocase subunit YajC
MLSAVTTIMAAASKGSGGSFPSILFILALAFGALWLIVIRPQRRKQKLQQSMQSELAIGDEVLTAGGVYGKVTRIDDDEVRIEIAPNVEVRLARRAIAAQFTEGASADAAATAEPEYASDQRSHSAFDAESDAEKPG